MITKAPLETQGHVFALLARCDAGESWRFTEQTTAPAFRAALDYLGVAVTNDNASADVFASAHETEAWRVQEAAIELRAILRYRAYLVEWIARGKPEPQLRRAAPVDVALGAAVEEVVDAAPESLMERFAASVTAAYRWTSSRLSRKPADGRNAWTGTSGTVSYYDKDSSPD